VPLERALGRSGVPADQSVDVDQPVQVVDLVLQATGEEAGAGHLHRRPVQVDAGGLGPAGAPGRELFTGHREAALPVVVRVRHGLRAARGLQHRVHHDAAPALTDLVIRAVVDEQPQVHADLVRRQSHAVGRGHGVEHVLDQSPQLVVEQADRSGGGAQHGIPDDPDRTNRHVRHPIGFAVVPRPVRRLGCSCTAVF
jgi:hypothetical protein